MFPINLHIVCRFYGLFPAVSASPSHRKSSWIFVCRSPTAEGWRMKTGKCENGKSFFVCVENNKRRSERDGKWKRKNSFLIRHWNEKSNSGKKPQKVSCWVVRIEFSTLTEVEMRANKSWKLEPTQYLIRVNINPTFLVRAEKKVVVVAVDVLLLDGYNAEYTKNLQRDEKEKLFFLLISSGKVLLWKWEMEFQREQNTTNLHTTFLASSQWSDEISCKGQKMLGRALFTHRQG